MKFYWMLAAAALGFNACAETIQLENLVPNGHLKNGKIENGEYQAEVVGNDPYFSIKNFQKADAAEVSVLKFDMKTGQGESKNGQIFWTTAEEPKFSEKNSVHFPIQQSDGWVSYQVELNVKPGWAGTITGLRIDPVAHPSHKSLAIRNIELTSLTVKNFPLNAWGINNHMQDRKIQEDGSLTCEMLPEKNDPMVIGPLFSAPADKLRYLKFDLAVPAGVGETAQVFFTTKEMKAFAADAMTYFKIVADGELHSYVIDFSANPKWKGEITRLRLDPTGRTSQGGPMILKNLRLEAEK